VTRARGPEPDDQPAKLAGPPEQGRCPFIDPLTSARCNGRMHITSHAQATYCPAVRREGFL
jgi:hypothetical protein